MIPGSSLAILSRRCRLAGVVQRAGLKLAKARHLWAAAPGGPGRCRHAGPDGLGGPVEDRGAEAWRRGLCLSRGRRRRLGRLSDRQDQGAHGHRIGGRRRQRRISQADRRRPRHRL